MHGACMTVAVVQELALWAPCIVAIRDSDRITVWILQLRHEDLGRSRYRWIMPEGEAKAGMAV
jgi:hypothetical protein